MIRHALCEPIEWVESMARVRGRHDPLMMGFMEGLVE